MICLFSKINNEKIISQHVGSGQTGDLKSDKVSKYDTSCYILSAGLLGPYGPYRKYGTLCMYPKELKQLGGYIQET